MTKITYNELADRVGDMVLNNYIMSICDNFELQNGMEYDEESDEYTEVYQTYIITDRGAEYLKRNTNELVYFNDDLNMYVWGITHYGTSWDDVEIELND